MSDLRLAPDASAPEVPLSDRTTAVRVVGIVRGREVNADARVSLDADTLVIAWPASPAWRVALEGIDGLAAADGALSLYLRDHDVLELTTSVAAPDALRELAARLTEQVCRLPEFTRGLREFGAVRRGAAMGAVRAGGPSPLHQAHDLWFAPLLDARRAVQGVSDPTRQAALLHGATLTTAMLDAGARIAMLLAPTDAAERRALDAAIEDEAAPLFRALTRLAHTADAVQHGASDTRFADWRIWVEACRATYAEADEAWAGIAEMVGES